MPVFRACVRPVRVHVERVLQDFRDLHWSFHSHLDADIVVIGKLRELPPDGFDPGREGFSKTSVQATFF